MSRCLHDSGDEEPKPWLQQAHVTDGVAAGGAALDTNGLTAGVAAGGAAGGAEESNTLQQQACATDDGEFEKMMARFDDRERQEAAADGRASATGLLLLPACSHCMADLLSKLSTTCNVYIMLTSSDWTSCL